MLQTYKTKLILKTQLTPDVILFRFELIEPMEINFQAGQYLMFKINDQSRLYSIFSPPDETKYFELLIQIVPGGVASEYFKNITTGTEVEFQGPAGAFTLRQNERNKIFLATGTGIAPIRSIMLQHYVIASDRRERGNLNGIASSRPMGDPRNDNNGNIFLFWGVKTYKDVYLFDELKQLAEKNNNFHFQICLSRETDLLKIPENDRKYFFLGHIDPTSSRSAGLRGAGMLGDSDYYICGSRNVVESLQTKLSEIGVQKENIIIEKF